jgi:hypothetical protein
MRGVSCVLIGGSGSGAFDEESGARERRGAGEKLAAAHGGWRIWVHDAPGGKLWMRIFLP